MEGEFKQKKKIDGRVIDRAAFAQKSDFFFK
jgi:hypothetical protein